MKPFILYGMPGSLYTGKVRSYLRKQGVVFEERTPGDPRFGAEVVPAVGRWIIPVLQTPQGQWLQDGADIIDYFEQGGLAGLSACPLTPLHRVVSLVFELFGGEGLLRPAMHYRWNFDDANLAFLRDDFAAALAPPGSTEAHKAAVFAKSSGAMRKAAVAFGVTAATVPLIEAGYLDFLSRFEAHLADSPYLLGGKPSRGDYGLVAPLYAHLGRDPYPAMLMKQRAPRVWRWVERMNAREQGAGEYANPAGDLFDGDLLPDTLKSMLRFVVEEAMAEITAHVAFTNQWLDARPDIPAGHNGLDQPGARSIGMASFLWRGVSIQTLVMPYRLYLLQRVQDAFEVLEAAARHRVRTALAEVGLDALLDLKAHRRVERRHHLEVWGAACGPVAPTMPGQAVLE